MNVRCIRPWVAAIALGCSLPLVTQASPKAEAAGYVARQENLRNFFEALSAPLGMPIILSKAGGRRSINGEFSFAKPKETLERIARQMGLIWYSDGQALYVYEAAEAKSSVGSLGSITVDKLTGFLRRSGLYDNRYPLRSDGLRTFYVSGPPIYVDLVMQAAQFMDSQSDDLQVGRQRIGVIKLHNTFVGDRQYDLRDESITVPGIATVIENLLKGEAGGLEATVSRNVGLQAEQAAQGTQAQVGRMPQLPLEMQGERASGAGTTSLNLARDAAAGNIRVVAYPDTNSLLVKGLPEQVRFIESLAAALDEPKRHVELSLWIIDLQKDDLNELGVDWSGSLKLGSQMRATLNGGALSTLDSASFIAAVSALESDNRARVVSRPIVLTQENIPAIFDNNRTFYASLIGERSVELESVTYGTLVSVLPRISSSNEIEMALNIEDGSEVDSGRRERGTDVLPVVGRTRISTVARVPRGKSLLVGGFTRDEGGEVVRRIPLLGHIPWVGGLFSYKQHRSASTVRVFLIQPKELFEPLQPGAEQIGAQVIGNVSRDAADRAVLRALER